MKKNFTRKTIQFLFIVFFSLISLNGYTQKTFTVVCDKTDKTVKVVESDERSPNYVPIKGGFPFRQVAQNWINENYSTTQCDPGEILDQIKQNSQNTSTQTNSISTAPPQQTVAPSNSISPGRTFQPPVRYKNTSFMINARFSNLGEAFNLKEKLMPGFEVGIEQLFGKKIYFGTGINVDFYFSNFDENAALEDDFETIYFFKIPAFIGYRTKSKNFMTMYEAGVAGNTKLTGTPLVLESFGQTVNNNSFNFLARLKVGTETVMLELGTDIWLAEIFENHNFEMSSVFLGLRFNF